MNVNTITKSNIRQGVRVYRVGPTARARTIGAAIGRARRTAATDGSASIPRLRSRGARAIATIEVRVPPTPFTATFTAWVPKGHPIHRCRQCPPRTAQRSPAAPQSSGSRGAMVVGTRHPRPATPGGSHRRWRGPQHRARGGRRRGPGVADSCMAPLDPRVTVGGENTELVEELLGGRPRARARFTKQPHGPSQLVNARPARPARPLPRVCRCSHHDELVRTGGQRDEAPERWSSSDGEVHSAILEESPDSAAVADIQHDVGVGVATAKGNQKPGHDVLSGRCGRRDADTSELGMQLRGGGRQCLPPRARAPDGRSGRRSRRRGSAPIPGLRADQG